MGGKGTSGGFSTELARMDVGDDYLDAWMSTRSLVVSPW